MDDRAFWEARRGWRARSRIAVLAVAAMALGAGLVAVASGNNLDRLTATQVAKDAARADCRHTSNCKDWAVRRLHRVSRHKAVGKIVVISTKNGEKFACRRQLVIKLDHFTGDIDYATSRRKCVSLGPA
jgi:hypothetical protein